MLRSQKLSRDRDVGPAALDNIQVVIPALNEKSSIAEVVLRLRNLGIDSIRVVDNGSTDRTSSAAYEAGATVVSEYERGYGAACIRGCRNLPEEKRWILFCDADGCDDLNTVERMIQASHRNDLILGNRRSTKMSRSALTLQQNIGNGLAVLPHPIWLGLSIPRFRSTEVDSTFRIRESQDESPKLRLDGRDANSRDRIQSQNQGAVDRLFPSQGRPFKNIRNLQWNLQGRDKNDLDDTSPLYPIKDN